MRTFLITILLFNTYWAQEPNANFELLNCHSIKGDFLWAAETELTNLQYREFLFSIRKDKGTEIYTKMLPDTLVWREKLAYNEPYVDYYFRHPSYHNYPVVGVSKKQAETYCEWLGGILNKKYANDPKHPVQKVDVRLPTDKEWQYAARGGNPTAIFPWEGNNMRRTDKKWQGQMRANFIRGRGDFIGIPGSLSDNADITAPAKSYWTNAYGLYNMSGNVAEMTQEKGRIRGGSWRNRAPYLEINAEEEYTRTKGVCSYVGFRYFIEVIDFKPIKPVKSIELTAKLIEKLLKSVSEEKGFFISKHEVTNELYNLFLQEKGNEKYTRNNELWLTEVEYARKYTNDYATHPKYKEYPVVNITKEGAIAFCKWLTNEYKTMPKTKYKGIEFKLPTEEEWIQAAKGKLDLNYYPWGGPYIRNVNGSLLCNYNPVEERWILDKDSTFLISGLTTPQIREAGRLDGHLITCNVTSYFPNDIGAYCMSGNAAEMISDKDITKGGSWGSFRYNVNLSATEPYSGASPYVGFRFVGIVVKKEL